MRTARKFRRFSGFAVLSYRCSAITRRAGPRDGRDRPARCRGSPSPGQPVQRSPIRGPSSRARSASSTATVSARSSTRSSPAVMCKDPRGSDGGRLFENGHYIGHDEPSVRFLSSRPGSGNNFTMTETLPKDPGRRADRQDARQGPDALVRAVHRSVDLHDGVRPELGAAAGVQAGVRLERAARLLPWRRRGVRGAAVLPARLRAVRGQHQL